MSVSFQSHARKEMYNKIGDEWNEAESKKKEDRLKADVKPPNIITTMKRKNTRDDNLEQSRTFQETVGNKNDFQAKVLRAFLATDRCQNLTFRTLQKDMQRYFARCKWLDEEQGLQKKTVTGREKKRRRRDGAVY